MAANETQPPERGYVSAWIPWRLRSEIEQLAVEHDRSLSGEVRVALRAHVEQQRGRAGLLSSDPSDPAAEGAS